MTKPHVKTGTRGGGYDRTATLAAASREAARAGRAEVDFDHLLLGVLVNGGPGARLLMDAGVGLAEARSAVDRLLQEDLALLGIEASPPAPSPPSGRDSPVLLPLAPRLRELEDGCPSAGGDRILLAALIGDEGGRVRRLLDRLDVDVDLLHRDLDEPIDDSGTPVSPPANGDRSTSSEQESERRDRAAYDRAVPVSTERLWSLLSDPERRGEWTSPGVTARRLDDGVVELTDENGKTVREWIMHSVPDREVTWATDAGTGPPPRTLRITIEPAGKHARLHLRKDWDSALQGRFANGVVRWIARAGLRPLTQIIAQAAAS